MKDGAAVKNDFEGVSQLERDFFNMQLSVDEVFTTTVIQITPSI